MKCQICSKENPENIMRCILGASSNDLYICDDCVDKFYGGRDLLALIGKDIVVEDDSFGGIDAEALKKSLQLCCSNCQVTLEEVGLSGLFGCEQCYVTFSDLIAMADAKIEDKNNKLKEIVGSKDNNVTEEKIPTDKMVESPVKEINESEMLKMQLDQAVKMENYEEAAKIRDQIEKLNKGEVNG